jgi:hypothetical protein
VKVIVDGHEFIGRVAEMRAERDRKEHYHGATVRLSQVQPLLRSKARRADNGVPTLQGWVYGPSAPHQSNNGVTPDQKEIRAGQVHPALPIRPASFDAPVRLQPDANRSSAMTTIPFRRIGAPIEFEPVWINSTEGLQSSRDAPLHNSLEVVQWRWNNINPGKNYQCAGVIGKGSFAKVTFFIIRFNLCLSESSRCILYCARRTSVSSQ